MSESDAVGPQVDTREPCEEDAPSLVRRLLKGVSAVLLIALMVGGGHLLLRLEPSYLPVLVVSVEGDVQRLPLQLLQETVSGELDGGILTQDLSKLKAAVEGLAWVDTAGVRRLWPDRLVISVDEHEPVARWGEGGLVTAAGIVFRPHPEEMPPGLPLLSGADEQAPVVAERFSQWRPRFAAQRLSIDWIDFDPRGAWTLHTDAGFTLALGKRQVERRLDRFLRAYPAIIAAGRPASVDMRYSNGLAVSWLEARVEAQGPRVDGDSDEIAVTGRVTNDAGRLSLVLDPRPSGLALFYRPSAPGPRPSRS